MRSDWVILALHSADRAELSPVQVQKAIFLLGHELGETRGMSSALGPPYNFKPYHYGPYSPDLSTDLRSLATEGVVDIRQGYYPNYSLTVKGQELGSKLASAVGANTFDAIRGIVQWVRQRDFSQLVRDIYERFPEQSVNSLFESRER